MNIKVSLFCLLLIGIAFNSNSQNIEKYIPANPSVVVQIKPSVLKRSISMEEFKELPMAQNMMKSLQGMFPLSNENSNQNEFTLEDMGIASDLDMYFYANMDEEGSVMALVMNLLDGNKFASAIKEMNLGDAAIMSIGDFQTKQNKDQFVSWGNGVAVVGNISKTAPPYDPYADVDWSEMEEEEYVDDDDVDEIEEMEDGESDEMEEELVEVIQEMAENEETVQWKNEKLKQALLPKSSAPAWKKKLTVGEGVVTAWMDYAAVMSSVQGGAVAMGAPSFMPPLNDALYGGMELLADMQFNQGEAVFKMNFTYPERLTKGGDITNAKINRKFKKYIKGDNLLGLYSGAFNMEAYGNMMKEMMFTAMDAMPETMGLGRDVAPLLGMLIDEEAIYNFFKGDMLIAVTGLKTFEKTVTEYQYDDDFNPIEKQTTEEAQIPEFTSMVSFGDRDNMQRIFKIGEKLGVLANMGDHFQVMAPLGFDLFLAMEKDILFISNDTELMTKNLTSGVSGNRIAGNRWKAVKKNAFHFYWDLPQTLNFASEMGFPVGEQTVNMSRESIREIVMSSPRKQGNHINSDIKLSFVNQKENSLKLILNFFNDLFFGSGTSM